MAYEYFIREGRWGNRRLRAALEEWIPRAPVPILRREAWARGEVGPGTWLLAENSVRGFSLDLDAGLVQTRGVRVRLNLMASRADWLCAQALTRALLDAGGGHATDAAGVTLRAEMLRDPDGAGVALEHIRADAAALAQELSGGRGFAALPNPAFALLVTPALLPDERDEGRFALGLEERLADMAMRYQRAAVVPLLALPDGSTLSVWSRDDALVALSHYIGIQMGETPQDGVVLRGQDLLSLMGDRLEAVSQNQDRFFLPALDPADEEDTALLQTLVQKGQPLEPWLAQFSA